MTGGRVLADTAVLIADGGRVLSDLAMLRDQSAIPPSRIADTDLGPTMVIRMDASLVIAHSDQELVAGTYQGSWGHHPLMAWAELDHDAYTRKESK
jgi:hypothetical protein